MGALSREADYFQIFIITRLVQGCLPLKVFCTNIGAILDQLGDPAPLRLRDLSPVRDFTHVTDAAHGVLLLAKAMSAGIFNLGTGIGTSIGDLARLMLSLAGQPDRSLIETAPDGGVSHLALDPTRLREATGWRPDIPLRTGLAQMIDGTA